MIRFNCDYSEGAHPRILEKLVQTNFEQTSGYGNDPYCRQAADLLKKHCQTPDAEVYFLSGGTQTNLTVLAAMLRPYQCVIAPDSGHINVHETGAIETTGHRILTAPNQNGKITAEQIARLCQEHWQDENPEFAPQPKAVYLSFPTEMGTLYSKKEMESIRRVCDEHHLFLFVDGARLGYGLTAPENDISLSELAACCDAFYIGGTKMGALLGEAVVIVNPKLQRDFRYLMKQRGAMLAKGRVLGLQFLALFEDNLYFTLGHHANKMASLIRQACQEAGIQFLSHSPTNQLFVLMPDSLLQRLEETYLFMHVADNAAKPGYTPLRICTSWATREDDVAQLCADIKQEGME